MCRGILVHLCTIIGGARSLRSVKKNSSHPLIDLRVYQVEKRDLAPRDKHDGCTKPSTRLCLIVFLFLFFRPLGSGLCLEVVIRSKLRP